MRTLQDGRPFLLEGRVSKRNGATIADLQPDPANTNRHKERGKVLTRKSVGKFGPRKPLEIDANGLVIDGNDRMTIYGRDEDVTIIDHEPGKVIAVRYPDFDLSDPANPAREYQIAQAKSGAESFDEDIEAILAHMEQGVNVGDWYEQGEIDALIAEIGGGVPEAGDAEPQTNRAEELRQEWQTETGQLWRMASRDGKGEHRLIVGDCTDREVVERVMGGGGEKAHCVITDPPYAVFGSSTGVGKDIVDDKMILPFCREVFRICTEVTDVTRHVYICCDWKSFNPWWSQLERFDLRPLNCIVWDKGDGGIGTNYTSRHEFVFFLNRESKSRTMTGKMAKLRPVHGVANVQRFNVPQHDDRLHNAAKPVGLIEVLVRASTDG